MYQIKAALDGIHSEMELQLAEGQRGTLLAFSPNTQDQLQEEMELEAKTLEDDTCHLCALLAAECTRTIKDFWRCNSQDIVQNWKAVGVDIRVQVPAAAGLCMVRVANTQTLQTEACDVIGGSRAFRQESNYLQKERFSRIQVWNSKPRAQPRSKRVIVFASRGKKGYP